MNGLKVFLGAALVLFLAMSAAGRVDRWMQERELNQAAEAPATGQLVAPAPTGDVEVTPKLGGGTNNGWTEGKQVFYEACAEAAVAENYETVAAERYCKCAANYMIDTYGIMQVAEWAEHIPPSVMEEVVATCL